MVDKDDWTPDMEIFLDKIRQNCVILCEQHKQQYLYLQSWLKYFRLPCIVLSSINAVASIGLQSYVNQQHVSLINCLISLITTIITSTELYLQIEKQMSVELDVSKDYYILSIDIHKILGLNKENRNIDASTYLDSCMSSYKNLFMHSMVLQKRIKDKLIILDCDMISPDIPAFTDLPCKDSKDIIDYASRNEYFIDIPPPSPPSQASENNNTNTNFNTNNNTNDNTNIDHTKDIICNEETCNVKNTFLSYWFKKQ
jgi:hypothetical protein